MDALTIGYSRVSTASGEQLSALQRQVSRLEAAGCDLILQDVESGLNQRRPQYQQLRRLVKDGRVALVLVTAISRLGRNAAESDAFVALCDERGVACRSLSEGQLTMATPEDLLLTRLRGSLSQGESMRLSQRVKAGLAEGRRHGRPMRKPCWGYRLAADRSRMEPDPEQWPRAQAFLEKLRGNSWRMLPTLRESPGLSPFKSCRGVRAWLLNPTIRGGIGYGQRANHVFDQITWSRHPALLSHAEFTEMERVIAHNRKLWGHNYGTIPRILTGLCECEECGSRMCYIAGRTHPSLKCRGEGCSQLYRSTRESVIVSYVCDHLTVAAAERLAATVNQSESAEAAELRRQIVQLEAMGDPELAAAIAVKRQRLESVLAAPMADSALIEKLRDRRWLDLATADELRLILQQTVARVVIAKQVPVAIRLRL